MMSSEQLSVLRVISNHPYFPFFFAKRTPRTSAWLKIYTSLGPLLHVPMSLFWLALHIAINDGSATNFTFRIYLTVMSSGMKGFFSTLSEQSCLINILLIWFNMFVPAYPLDGGKLMVTSMLLMGVALNKAALLSFLVSILVSLALFSWSVVSFLDGVGITGTFIFLVAIFVMYNSYQTYSLILTGRLREHALFGRDCYINRVSRHISLQLVDRGGTASGDARDNRANNVESDDETGATDVDYDL